MYGVLASLGISKKETRGTWVAFQSAGNDGLVLDGVEGAGRVDNAPSGCEHLHCALEDAELQAVCFSA